MSRTQVMEDCPVHFRVAGPRDAEMIRDFINGLTVRTQFLRFFASVAPPSSGLLRGLCGAGGSADVILAFHQGSVIGHCMAVDKTCPDGALASEVGLVVADRWQQQGVGTALLRAVAARATARGARTLVMDVLPGNDRMLGMIERRWPGARRDRTADSVIIRASLTAANPASVAVAVPGDCQLV